MLQYGNIERVNRVSQISTRIRNKKVLLLVRNLTDDFLVGGSPIVITKFIEIIRTRFIIRKYLVDDEIVYCGCDIEQKAEGTIPMSMIRYIYRLEEIYIEEIRTLNG
eukprot:gb/GEZJ01008823.1/.p1 GENE.gb/GEZJ01008823.1/~~gb/GEZJ01008823.1/.p1  ORF type:complete len:107 (-),score=11.63 gb/GEZJ01008823.1/:24-344(-)